MYPKVNHQRTTCEGYPVQGTKQIKVVIKYKNNKSNLSFNISLWHYISKTAAEIMKSIIVLFFFVCVCIQK